MDDYTPPCTRKRKCLVEVEGCHHGPSSSSSSSPVKATTTTTTNETIPISLRWMFGERMDRYYEQIKQSDGFEVDDFSDCEGYGMITPVDGNIQRNRELLQLCSIAMKHYKENVKKDAKLRFVRLVRENYDVVGRYYDYYITFEAKDVAGDHDDQVKTFQAILIVDYVTDEPPVVELFRLKPTPTPTPTPTR